MEIIYIDKLPLYEADPPYTRQNKVIVDAETGAKGASLGIGIYRKGERALMHTHENEEEIIYFTKGKVRITLGDTGEVFELGEDTAVFIPPGEPHLLENIGDGELKFFFVYSPPGPESGIKKWKVVG
jgi:oxalate decarboxylase/phosphoglucose isomerase-like protein (cupin superfamily)